MSINERNENTELETKTENTELKLNPENADSPKGVSGKKPDNNKKKRNIIIAIASIIVIAIIIILLLLRSCGTLQTGGDDPSKPGISFNVDVDPNATQNIKGDKDAEHQAIVDALNEKVKQSMINISMNTNPIFENGSSAGNLLIVNNEVNNYPQVIEIYRDDTDELIYQSKLIPVGTKIDSAKLDTDLKKGIYPCTAYFNAVDAETGALIGKAGAKISITILE